MAEKKSLKLNFIMNAILTMSSFLFPLISFPYVSRVLGPEGTGRVDFATSLIAYFLMFAQLGIPTYGVRACAKVRDDRRLLTKTAHELLIINLVMSMLSYAVLALGLIFVPVLRQDRMLYVVVSLTIIFNTIGMEWLYKALEQYTYITVRSIIFKLVALVAMFALIRTKGDYMIYGGITILASSASYLMNFFHARKYISLRPMGGYEFKPHLKAVMVFFAMACATTVYTNMDKVMLGVMISPDSVYVGYYGASTRIKSILVSIVTSLGTVLLPRASYYVQHGKMEEFRKISRKALNFVVLAATPLMLYFIFFARQGILLLSGEEYLGAVLPMQLIMPTLLFIGLTNILGIQILVPTGREKLVLYSVIVGAATDVVCNLLLIPNFQAAGAALSNMIAEAAVLIFQIVVLRHEVLEAFRSISYWKVGAGLLAGTAASLWVAGLGLGSFLSLVLSACLFFGAYALVLLLTKEQLVMELCKQLGRKIFKR
ncbi:MAG: flippase [Oscillospiraceae bacterium]|nr:flippase [Oscillospiraceae bacterium]